MILEEHGRFWWHHEPVPEGHFAPENSVTGTLKIADDGGAKLTLHGALLHTVESKDLISANNQIAETVSIQGRLNDTGRHVILSCLHTASMKFSGYGTFEGFRADYSLVGHHNVPATMEQMAVSSIAAELDGFEEWLRLASIEYSRADDGFSATYKKDEDIIYELDNGTLGVKYELYAPWHNGRLEQIKAKQAVSVIYTSANPLNFKETVQLYQLLQDLFILLTNSNHPIGSPEISLQGTKGTYDLYFHRNKGKEDGPKRFEAWIDFPDLKLIFGTIFGTWMAKREIFGPAFHLYLGTRRGQPQYIENRYLNLIVGVEAFHREKFPESITSAKLAEKIARILGSIEKPSDKRWLKGRLKNAAEPSLEERLYELIMTLPFGHDERLVRAFAKDCAKLRNDISHFGGRHRRADYNKFLDETWCRCDVIAFYYQALILREIGLGDEVLKRWLQHSPKAYLVKVQMARLGLCEDPGAAARDRMNRSIAKAKTAVNGESLTEDQTAVPSPLV